MFKRLPRSDAAMVTILLEGAPVEVAAGDTVAAAVFGAGLASVRTTPVSGTPRTPYCLMGVCFECLVTIDGVGNRQGCLIEVHEGMTIETQSRRREAGR